VVDNPLNVSKPLGMSQGDFYEYHYALIRNIMAASSRRTERRQGLERKKLGLKRYNPALRIWNGTPWR